jgi:hypothetical protein
LGLFWVKNDYFNSAQDLSCIAGCAEKMDNKNGLQNRRNDDRVDAALLLRAFSGLPAQSAFSGFPGTEY